MRFDRASLAAAASTAARMTRGEGQGCWSEVRLVAKADRLWLTAMDSINRVEISVPGEGDLDPICVNAAKFAEIVSSLPAETVDVNVDGPRLSIVGGRGRRQLATTSAADYPEAEFNPTIEVTIPAVTLRDALAFTLPHVAPIDDPTKRTMSGVHLIAKDKRLRAIGTDACEMGVFDLGRCAQSFGVTMNPKVAEFASRLIPDGSVILRVSERQAEVSWSGGLIRGPLIGEDFPIVPVEHALAKDYERSASLEAKTFLEAIQSIRPIGQIDSLSKSRRVKLVLNGCGIVSTESGEGSAEQEFPADWPGDPRVTGFAAVRMERVLRHFGDSVLTIGIRDDESAMKIEAEGQGDRLCLLFPLKV